MKLISGSHKISKNYLIVEDLKVKDMYDLFGEPNFKTNSFIYWVFENSVGEKASVFCRNNSPWSFYNRVSVSAESMQSCRDFKSSLLERFRIVEHKHHKVK